MAVSRKKEQSQNQFNQNGQLKLTQVKYSYRADGSSNMARRNTAVAASIKPKQIHSAKDLFSYDVNLIFSDLRKTIFITLLIIVLLLVITWYLRR